MIADLFTKTGATFSPCKRYRYTLFRSWGPGSHVVFCMLNPSKATADVTDNTITRCINFAHLWGFDGLEVVNLFALRSTDPSQLFRVDDPIGPDNDRSIEEATAGKHVIVAWGVSGPHKKRGKHLHRDQRILELIYPKAATVQCLGMTMDGTPRHPLFIKGNIERLTYPLQRQA